jgi:type II secretory pathway pseudopilin PulG
MNFSIHSRRGQTLVEALVALSILTVGFVGIVTLLSKSFQLNRTTSNDTQATYLAAEGIEVAKNIIDYDVYNGLAHPGSGDWGCSFDLPLNTPTDYELEYDTTVSGCTLLASVPAAKAQSDHLYFSSSTDFYSYDNFPPAVETDFTRDVKITAVSNAELDVQSTVTWTDGGLGNTITLEDHFYDWNQ